MAVTQLHPPLVHAYPEHEDGTQSYLALEREELCALFDAGRRKSGRLARLLHHLLYRTTQVDDLAAYLAEERGERDSHDAGHLRLSVREAAEATGLKKSTAARYLRNELTPYLTTHASPHHSQRTLYRVNASGLLDHLTQWGYSSVDQLLGIATDAWSQWLARPTSDSRPDVHYRAPENPSGRRPWRRAVPGFLTSLFDDTTRSAVDTQPGARACAAILAQVIYQVRGRLRPHVPEYLREEATGGGHHGSTGPASLSYLASRTGFSEDTVSRALRVCLAAGYLRTLSAATSTTSATYRLEGATICRALRARGWSLGIHELIGAGSDRWVAFLEEQGVTVPACPPEPSQPASPPVPSRDPAPSQPASPPVPSRDHREPPETNLKTFSESVEATAPARAQTVKARESLTHVLRPLLCQASGPDISPETLERLALHLYSLLATEFAFVSPPADALAKSAVKLATLLPRSAAVGYILQRASYQAHRVQTGNLPVHKALHFLATLEDIRQTDYVRFLRPWVQEESCPSDADPLDTSPPSTPDGADASDAAAPDADESREKAAADTGGPSTSAPRGTTSADLPPWWRRVLERLQGLVSQHNFSSWFDPSKLRCLEVDDGQVTLEVDDEFRQAWIADNYADLLTQATEAVLGEPVSFELRARSLETSTELEPICWFDPAAVMSSREAA